MAAAFSCDRYYRFSTTSNNLINNLILEYFLLGIAGSFKASLT